MKKHEISFTELYKDQYSYIVTKKDFSFWGSLELLSDEKSGCILKADSKFIKV